MNEKMLNINYMINDTIVTVPTKMFYTEHNGYDYEFDKLYFQFSYKKYNIISKSRRDTEYALINLQKALPLNIRIACCLSCENGHFCPCGNEDDEIFCLKGYEFRDKRAVHDFTVQNEKLTQERSKYLLDFCKDYKPITRDGKYVYNDWQAKF